MADDNRRSQATTIAGAWEEAVLGILHNLGDDPDSKVLTAAGAEFSGNRMIFYLGAQATLICILNGAKMADLAHEIHQAGEDRYKEIKDG